MWNFRPSREKESHRIDTLTEESVRRALPEDVEDIDKLRIPQTEQMFGDREITEIMNTCYVTLVIENDVKSIVGCIALHNFPNVLAPPSWEWEDWMKWHYKVEMLEPWNTLFIHFMVWSVPYTFTFLYPLLRVIYVRNYFLEYIVLFHPPGNLPRLNWMTQYSVRIFPKRCTSEARKVLTLYLMTRENFAKKYKIRMAVQEDNDDLIPLIAIHETLLQELYGPYYVAEILAYDTSHRQIIVAEHEGIAVGVVFLNCNVNYTTLNEQFELVPFRGLRKPDDRDSVISWETMQTSSSVQWGTEERQASKFCSSHAHPSAQTLTLGDTTDRTFFLFDDDDSDEKSVEEEEIVEYEEFPGEGQDDRVTDVDELSLGSLNLDDILSYQLLEEELEGEEEYSPSATDVDEESHRLKTDTSSSSRFRGKRSAHRIAQRVPHFYGEENAFAVEVAVTHPDHEEALCLLLEAAFQCFPDRDYCILTLPSTVERFSLLSVFVKASPRPLCNYPHELYVLHRNAISGSMLMRSITKSDMEDVNGLIAKLPKPEMIREFCEAALTCEMNNYMAFVIENDGLPVGLAVVTEETDLEYISIHYDLSRHTRPDIHKTYGMIEFFLLMPAFHMHFKYLMRELHRVSDCDVLLYTVDFQDLMAGNYGRQRPLSNCLVHMTPVQGNELTVSVDEDEEGSESATRIEPAYSLYCSTVTICSVPTKHINTKIVVIGSSDCAIAFLEAMLFTSSPYYRAVFSNITVVSPHGLNYQKPPHTTRDMMFVTRSTLSYRYMQMNNLRTYVNVVHGVLTGINRKDKFVQLNGEHYLPYDMLFLFCGEQYQMIKSKSYAPEHPENVFVVNTETDAAHALVKLRLLKEYSFCTKNMIIVYGHNIESYCCVAALLDYGIPASHIVLVEPFPMHSATTPPHQYAFFNDQQIDTAVREIMVKQGVTMYESYKFVDWTYCKEKKLVTRVQFESKYRLLDLECLALFVYNEKSISKKTFLAIHKSGLVFDGLLVIQPDCRTNDPNIYAAGTMTKYSRRYYADHMYHRFYNVYEIGHQLGKDVRKKLTHHPLDSDKTAPVFNCRKGTWAEMPTYSKPLFQSCSLPGKLRYMCVSKPGKEIPLVVKLQSEDYGSVLKTGHIEDMSKKGYFKLHINGFSTVETITCLAPFEIEGNRLFTLWGKHVKLLNNVAERFERGYITDLFEYFKEPWASAIYNEKFTILEENIRDLMMANLVGEDGEEGSLVEDLMTIFKNNDWTKLTRDQLATITEKFLDSFYHEQLEELVIHYLQLNMKRLPMYATPILVKLILQTRLKQAG